MIFDPSGKVWSINFEPPAEGPWTNAVPAQLWLFLVKITSSWHYLVNNACPKSPKSRTQCLKPDFNSCFSLVVSGIFRIGHAQSGETNRTGRKKYLSVCLHLKFKYFNFCEIFSHETNQTFFLSYENKKFSQNDRPTALSGLIDEKPQ